MAARLWGVLGIQVLMVAVGWQVYSHSKRPMDLAYVGLSQFLPIFGLSLVAGHVADQFSKPRILQLGGILQFLCCVAFTVLAWQDALSRPVIYFLLFSLGTARAFQAPASHALISQLIPISFLARAMAWSSSIWQFATITGPALGGYVYSWGKHAAWVYGVSSLFLLVHVICTFFVRTIEPAPRRTPVTVDALTAGLRYVWRNKLILGAVSLDLMAVLLGGAVALMPAFAQDVLHAGPSVLGLLRSAPAAGAASMALLLARFPIQTRAGRKLFVAVFIFGLATIAFGYSRSLPVAFICLVVVGASDMISVVLRQTLVQLSTPMEMRGRVSAVNSVFISASNELGEVESGATAQWLGLVPAIIVGGIGTCLVVLIWDRVFPALRRADRLDGELPR
jgi:MFS family permease